MTTLALCLQDNIVEDVPQEIDDLCTCVLFYINNTDTDVELD